MTQSQSVYHSKSISFNQSGEDYIKSAYNKKEYTDNYNYDYEKDIYFENKENASE